MRRRAYAVRMRPHQTTSMALADEREVRSSNAPNRATHYT